MIRAADEVVGRRRLRVAQGDHDAAERSDILATAEELMHLPTRFYTCHCTGLPAFDLMKSVMGDRLRYVHSGDIIEL